MKRANSDTICDALLQMLNIFDEGKMLMLSMDDPMMNWAVFNKLRQHKEENKIPVLFDIDSCSLHVVHGAFQVEWNRSKVFLAMWKILHDSCARRDIYKTVNRIDLFPLPFCEACWVEDKNVAARGIAIKSYMIKFIKNYHLYHNRKGQKIANLMTY